MAKKKSKIKNSVKSTVKSLIIVAIMAGLIILAYYRVSNRETRVVEEDVEISAAQEILLRNLDISYPPSPKELIKYYSDLTKVLYDSSCTDEEIELLAERALLLYDDELAANQQWDRYLIDLKSEIAAKRSQDYSIMNYVVSASTDVTYFEKDNYECASLYCTYTTRTGTEVGSVQELFILRKDEAGHWRILGWDLPQDDM